MFVPLVEPVGSFSAASTALVYLTIFIFKLPTLKGDFSLAVLTDGIDCRLTDSWPCLSNVDDLEFPSVPDACFWLIVKL